MKAFLLIFLLMGSFSLTPILSAATIYSNGTGGGDFLEDSTWVGGVAPGQTGGGSGPTSGWTVAAGDNVIMGANVYITNNQYPKNEGALTIDPGAYVVVNRYNYLISANAVLNVTGGYIAAQRFTGGGEDTFNITAGTMKCLTSLHSFATSVINISGGNLDLSTSGGASLPGEMHLSGNGEIILARGANNGSLSGFISGSTSWDGGTVILNSAYYGGTPPSNSRYYNAYFPFLAWKTSDNNILKMSSGSTAIVAGDGDADGYSLSSSAGTFKFNFYSSTSNDCDVFDWDNPSNSLALDDGVDLELSGFALSGNGSDYLGKSYKIFQLNDYSQIAPTLLPTTVTFENREYEVVWTNNLAVDGSLTVAQLKGNLGTIFRID